MSTDLLALIKLGLIVGLVLWFAISQLRQVKQDPANTSQSNSDSDADPPATP